MDVIERAFLFALYAHKGQTRKGDDTPYIAHPVMVAFKLQGHDFSDAVIAAALVHDVVEDCNVAIEEIERALGREVFDIVQTVTHKSGLPWEERKMAYARSVRNGSIEAKAVSLADKIHNMESLKALYEREGKGTWSYFNRGKEKRLWFEELMLSIFKETWEHPMIDEYETLVSWMRTAD